MVGAGARGVRGAVWLAGGELRGAAEVLRQANADRPGQWQGEAEEAPPSPSGCSGPSQVANGFPRLHFSRMRAEVHCDLEHPYIQRFFLLFIVRQTFP